MKKVLLVLLTALTAACAFPQTREEFVKAIRGGAGLSSYEEVTVNESLKSTLARLEQPLKTCLNVTINVYAVNSGGARIGGITTTTYRTKMETKGNGKAALTMQATHGSMIGSSPPGGIYEVAVDFEAVGGNKTKAVIYSGRSGLSDLVQALKSWMSGRPAECSLTKGAKPKSS